MSYWANLKRKDDAKRRQREQEQRERLAAQRRAERAAQVERREAEQAEARRQKLVAKSLNEIAHDGADAAAKRAEKRQRIKRDAADRDTPDPEVVA